jgi:CheY-like chemotaxis protein
MPNGGRLTLGTSTVRLSARSQPGGCAEKLPDGEYALISITDNGTGMTDEVKAHLFEPFFTTKDHGLGSGLGLATSYGIVRQSGGHICIESEVGKGTMVTIYLPKVPAPAVPSYRKPGSRKAPTGTETVLVLEDDVSVRHISIRVLRSLGYDVLEAANGEDAQRLILFDADKKIDLLLTDMVMPQMSGIDFANWLRITSPETKVVFISGYLESRSRRPAAARRCSFCRSRSILSSSRRKYGGARRPRASVGAALRVRRQRKHCRFTRGGICNSRDHVPGHRGSTRTNRRCGLPFALSALDPAERDHGHGDLLQAR